MSVDDDAIVRIELVSVASGLAFETLKTYERKGKIPKREVLPNRNSRAWRMSTVRAWNPRLAAKCEGLMQSPHFPAEVQTLT